MVQNERIVRHELVVEAGRRMMMAARTAPKARGVDIIEIALVSERDAISIARCREYIARRCRLAHRHACSQSRP